MAATAMRVTEYCAKHNLDPKAARARLRREVQGEAPDGGWVVNARVLKVLEAMRTRQKTPKKGGKKTKVAKAAKAAPKKTRVAKKAPATPTPTPTDTTQAA